ncbi:hypothetical protein DQ04_12901000 [Trypanosoma grayi]|uniref:hypothetical protein n=1 Tax=Trypanosoma grayi TaxID=71804 RepID=UPI0004F4494E|nr:hypothetical protein DQ04_12901000 [Trypanosoma grayi]KEG06653.1 hypothetical protein DQ04_12901000 [Trypanosoma grayi]
MLRKFSVVIGLTVFLLTLCGLSHADRLYTKGDAVSVYADAVFQPNELFERYDFYSLPFCRPAEVKLEAQKLWDILYGSAKRTSSYQLFFATNSTGVKLCRKSLNKDKKDDFVDAVRRNYMFSMHVDDFELTHNIGWGGEKDGAVLITGLLFKIFFNADRIVKAHVESLETQRVVLSAEPQEIDFTYSVLWFETNHNRGSLNLGAIDLDEEVVRIQWISIVNSFVIVILLSGFVLFILARTLRRDFQRYGSLEEEMDEEDIGWKRLHADVFRFPRNKMLLCAVSGCGAQLLLVAFVTLMIAWKNVLNGKEGAMINTVMPLFLLTAPVSGYVSGSLYKKLEGEHWSRSVCLTFLMLFAPFFVVCVTVNVVASISVSAYAVPWGRFCFFCVFFVSATFPLILLGAVLGKRFCGPFAAPTRTKFVPREIPPLPWYRRTLLHVVIGGLLPFMAIYIELHYILVGLWTTRLHTPVAFILIMFLVLVVVTASEGIALTYDRLGAENHNWWWPSVLCGGSTAVYVFVYCAVFYFGMTPQIFSGLSLVIFFGYTLFICHCLFLSMATVSFCSSLLFVKQIYRYIKSD